LREIIDILKKDISPQPISIPRLDFFQSRGAENTISGFFKLNFKAQTQEQTAYQNTQRTVQSKQAFNFLYIINGSGYGKTWLCFYAEEQDPTGKVLRMHSDFINASRFLYFTLSHVLFSCLSFLLGGVNLVPGASLLIVQQ
jgi:hypothetical protein